MKRFFSVFSLIALPVLFFLNVRQAVQFEQLKREVTALEAEQDEWLESNKRAIAGIELLTSPRRLEEIGTAELGLTRIDPSRITVVRLQSGASE